MSKLTRASKLSELSDLSLLPIKIRALSDEGRGIGEVDGKTVFVENALIGEVVKVKYLNTRGKFNEAVSEVILDKSEDRIDPPRCVYFGLCGGCSLQHLSPEAQRLHKQNVLASNLKHLSAVRTLEPEIWLSPLSDQIWGYRKKARLGVKFVPKKGGVLVGFRERNGRYIVDMDACPILDPSVGEKIPMIKKYLNQMDAKSTIPQIEVACDDQVTALIIRHLEALSPKDLNLFQQMADEGGYWIYLQPKGPDSVKLFYRGSFFQESSQDYLFYTHPKFDIKIKFNPQDFTQVNSGINLKMVERAVELLDPGPEDKIIDFFCGLGNFSLPMATRAGYVLGIEGDAAMVDKAKQNAVLNQDKINEIDFLAADLFKSDWIAQLRSDPNFNSKFNIDLIGKLKNIKVLLDPPRSGAESVVRFLGEQGVEKIVYISCNPATLARDAGILVGQYNYKLSSAGIMDMFPHTAHVESMAVFIKK